MKVHTNLGIGDQNRRRSPLKAYCLARDGKADEGGSGGHQVGTNVIWSKNI